MKVRITASGLPVPVGTIMEVGDAPPLAWKGKYEVVEDVPDIVGVEDKPRTPWRKPKPG